jgi:uncharacterized membrane protein
MSEQYSIPPADDATENDRIMAALSYPLPIVAIIILLAEEMRIRPFQRYHAVQALAANAVLWAIIILLGCVLSALSFFIGAVCGILALMLWFITLYWAYQAYQGLYFEIPVLTRFMQDQGWL